MEMTMKTFITAAILALAFTGTASAYDYFASESCGDDNFYAVKKPENTVQNYGYYTNERIQGSYTSAPVETDSNPSKLKKELQLFDQFSD